MNQVFCGDGVGERDPRQVAKTQHESEAVSGDIHRSKDGPLLVKCVPYVKCLESIQDPHAGRNVPLDFKLFLKTSNIKKHPTNQARAQFTKLLPVKIYRGNKGWELQARI